MIFIFSTDAGAQGVSRVRADIPFDFYVGSELLPKGKYEFEPANRQIYSPAVIVRSLARSNHRSLIIPTRQDAPQNSAEGFSIVFNRYGTVHYLSVITTGSDAPAFKLVKTSGEKQLARMFENPEPVAIRPTVGSGN